MARKATAKKQKSMEETLWDSANKLRGSVEPSEYKHVVLSLIFLKFISDTFEESREELIAEGKEKYIDMVDFYTMKNVFYNLFTGCLSCLSHSSLHEDEDEPKALLT